MGIIGEVLETAKKIKPRTQHNVFTQLVEEVGELSTEIAIQDGFSTKEEGPDGILGESVDVFINSIDMIYITYALSEEKIEEVIRLKLQKWLKKKGL